MTSLLSPSLAQVRSRFIRQFGNVGVLSDIAPSIGQLLGLMVFDGRDYSFSQLATELDLSRGAVSHAVGVLERQGVLTRYSKPPSRQDFFHLNAQTFEALVDKMVADWAQARRDVEASLKDAIAAQEALPEGLEMRLQDLINFYASFERFFTDALKNYRTYTPPPEVDINDERTVHGDTN